MQSLSLFWKGCIQNGLSNLHICCFENSRFGIEYYYSQWEREVCHRHLSHRLTLIMSLETKHNALIPGLQPQCMLCPDTLMIYHGGSRFTFRADGHGNRRVVVRESVSFGMCNPVLVSQSTRSSYRNMKCKPKQVYFPHPKFCPHLR